MTKNWSEVCDDPRENKEKSHQESVENACRNFGDQRLELANEIKEVREAVQALTSVHVEVGRHPESGAIYYSGDFRDHPEFYRYFEVLKKEWGKLPADHHRRKSLEMMQAMVSQREKAQINVLKLESRGEEVSSHEYTNEIVWRQVAGVDIFMVGTSKNTPNLEYYRKNQEYYLAMARQAGVISLEGFSDMPLGESLTEFWERSHPDHPKYGKNSFSFFLRELAKENPDAFLVEIDPRDSSDVVLDSTETSDFPEMPPEFFATYFRHLSEVSPNLALNILADKEKLAETVQKLSFTLEGLQARSMILKQKGIAYMPFSFLDDEHQVRYEPTGLEFGETTYSDAMSALKLRRLAALIKSGKIPTQGPVLDIAGALHTHGKRYYFDNPDKAFNVLVHNPQFVHLHLASDPEITTEAVRQIAQEQEITRDDYHVMTEEEKATFKKAVLDRDSRLKKDIMKESFSDEMRSKLLDGDFWKKLKEGDPYEIPFYRLKNGDFEDFGVIDFWK